MQEKTNIRRMLIKLVDSTTIKGKTNIQQFNRLSDAINSADKPFVTMFDVSIQGHEGQVVFVNKSNIVWVMPVDDE